MGLLSLLQKPRTAPSQELWQRAGFEVIPLAGETQAVHVCGRTPQIVPAFAVEFALECRDFRPLAEHVAEYAELHHWDSLQTETLQQLLPALAEGGLLLSTAQLEARLRAMPAAAETTPPPISTLGLPTGGARGDLVERALRSFAGNLQRHGRSVTLLVADSSGEPAQTRVLRGRLAHLQPALGQPLLLAGAAEKRAFAAQLVRRGACPSALAEFALLDPLGTGFACGSNRNALLLHAAGELLASVDDDVVCQLTGPPEAAEPGVGFFSERDPLARWFYQQQEEALSAALWVERDYLGEHEALLGYASGTLLHGQSTLDFTRAGEKLGTRVCREACRVRATFAGHLGDPGIPTSTYHLYYDGANRARLCASAQRYEALFHSRQVAAVASHPMVGDATIAPGMAFAVDHRTLLPPFMPVLHAEDYAWGTALWQSCPEALLGHIPWAVRHDPGAGKQILAPRALRLGQRAPFFEFAHLLRRLLLAEDPPAAASAAVRLGSLGRRLAELGTLALADFQDVIAEYAVREVGIRVQYLTEQLEEDPGAPDFWRADVEQVIRQLTASLEDSTCDIPLDLQTGRAPEEARGLLHQLLARYGELLIAWPAMVEAARELRVAGVTLGQPVRD